MTNKIEVVNDPAEADDCDYVVCVRLTSPLVFPDNLIDICCRCGEAIQHRPHIPTKPKKICQQCVSPDLESQAAKGELTMMITPKTAGEIADYFRKKNAN